MLISINLHQEYAKIYAEIKAIQSGQVDDGQLLQMWADIEKEQEMLRIDEMRMENQMRERELRKQELQRNWRSGGTITTSNSSSSSSLKSSTDTTAIDMDVEEIIGSTKPLPPSGNNVMQVATGTSPLLSSLLKSPTATTAPPAANNINTSSARATAPTITTLLTGGSIPNPNQPAIIPSRDGAIQLLARPLSGPPIDSIRLSPSSAQQTLLSPSQSAPTLSMLLEKNKSSTLLDAESKNSDICGNATKDTETVAANDSNNESIPMDIEEDLPITTQVNQETELLQSDDIDDTDQNEEQQLMEVFKNIGNIEELDIDVSAVIDDEEVDFLKGVDEDDATIEDGVEMGQKLEDTAVTVEEEDMPSKQEDVDLASATDMNIGKEEPAECPTDPQMVTKVDLISSDDSNDNIPLAAVASLESSKDRINDSSNESSFLKEQEESAFPKNESDQVDLENESTKVAIKQEMLDEQNVKIENTTCHEINDKIDTMEAPSQQEDVFRMPTMEEEKLNSNIKTELEGNENNIENQQQDLGDAKIFSEVEEMNGNSCILYICKDINESPHNAFDFTAESNHPSEQNEMNEHQLSAQPQTDMNSESNMESTSSLSMLQPPPAISIADTDENSSSTDISVQTRKDEKFSSNRRNLQHQRKSPNDAKTDDEMPNPSIQMAVPNNSGNLTPRPTALRKLRDRDRSESPMIDDDATTQSDHSTTTNQRSRRRYSSTPVIDSIPNSPASSDRDESRDLNRTYKKSLLSIYNVLHNSKNAGTLQKVFSGDTSTYKLEDICLKPIDFISIKKNIEAGSTRTIYELQRDVLLMCQNALFILKSNSPLTKNVLAFQQECQNIREFMPNCCDPQGKLERDARDTKSSGSSSSTGGGSTSKGRSGSRKSLRLS